MAAAHYAIADEDGEYVDWIELYNGGSTSVNLAGWHLTDDELEPAKWTFPKREIAPGGHLVIFASGKDRARIDGFLHTNFSLDQDGEYLALVRPDGSIEDKLAFFPSQIPDVSYDREGKFLLYPTPGLANRTDALAITSAPEMNHSRGFKAKPFALTMRTRTDGATMRYTLDGSTPSINHGEVYRSPIPISRTTVVRAIALKDPQLPSPIVTRTFLFTSDIVTQSPGGNAPKGWPKGWGTDHAVDYGMDPKIVNLPGVRSTIQNDLKTIPSLSLVMELKDLFSNERGIYANPQETGPEWERAMSLELIDPSGESGMQINGGVRIRGGASRDPSNPKHSFHFVFRREYGAAQLEYPMFGASGARRFDKFDLRCAQTNSWHFWIDEKTDFIRDQFARDTQASMGHPATRGDYYHLYINGQYWGLYNTQEKPDADFGASYFGGSEDDYDWIKYDNDESSTVANDGTFAAWRRLCEMGAKGFDDNAIYFKVQGLSPNGTRNSAYVRLLDIDNLIDYMLLGIYAGATDNPPAGGGNNNWSGIRHRGGDFGFQFFAHDFEFSLDSVFDDLLEDEPVNVSREFLLPLVITPWHFWQALRRNPEFRLRVADRLQKHFFENGALTPEACAERFKMRMQEIDRAVVGESARWGDATPERRRKPFRREDWLKVCNEHLLQEYFPQRSSIVLRQFRDASLFPNVNAPIFSPKTAAISAGEVVQITNPNESGTIYFTTDGSDPRFIGGGVAPGARNYSNPISLVRRTRIKARIKDGETWSALVEADFALGIDYSALRFTEIHYNPTARGDVPGEEYEFVELHNAGASAANLSGFTFTAGITFTFPAGTNLMPGGYLVLVRNAARFAEAHPGVAIGGIYEGRLDNVGEKLTLSAADGMPVLSMSYSDHAPWPIAADGLGFSIVLAKDRNLSEGDNWRASSQQGGSPGVPDPAPTVSAPVVVNEIVPRPGTGDQHIELFNAGMESADISGWWLTNDLAHPRKFRIPSGTVLASGAYAVFTGAEFSRSSGPDGGLSFASTGDGAWVIAANPDGTPTGYAHGFTFGAARKDVAFGRWINSNGDEQFPAESNSTFGGANSSPLASPLRITEVQYRPLNGDLEWVELRNNTLAPVDLGGWRLDGFGFTFETGAQIPGQGVAFVVSGDPAVFRQKYAIWGAIPVYGPAPGTLQDNGEEIALRQPSDLESGAFVTVDRVRYNDKAPWPVWGDTEGFSLQRIATTAYGDEPQSWLAGAPSPGGETTLPAPPRVHLVEPVHGSNFTGPATIRFRANVSDADSALKRVDFLFDGVKVGEAVAAPWELVWTGGSDGIHDLCARAIDNTGATAESALVSIRIDEPDRGSGLGLRGEYYAGSELQGTPVVRIDPLIDMHWFDESPVAGIPNGPVSIRWTGKFLSRRTGEFLFTIRAYGGVRLWIDNVLKINAWDGTEATEYSASQKLNAGAIHSLRLEYRNSNKEGAIALLLSNLFDFEAASIAEGNLYSPDQDPMAVGIITPAELPDASRGMIYRTALHSILGKEPLSWTWQALPGSILPAGLTLHTDGVITGIAEKGGEFRLKARVQDAEGKAAEKAFVLRIDDRNSQVKPRVSLTSPRQNSKVAEGSVKLIGNATAFAGRRISQILYAVNGDEWRSLTTKSQWEIPLSVANALKTGFNTLRVKARDDQGQESAIVQRRFFQVVSRPLTVDIVGRGMVASGFQGESQRELGRNYTIQAKPAPGWSFAEWEMNGEIVSTAPTLTFMMEEDMALTAVFRRHLFPGKAGTYAGLLIDDLEPLEFSTSGAATITVNRQGRFTASIRTGAEHFTLRGRFNRAGTYFTSMAGADGTDYDIQFYTEEGIDPPQIGVSVTWPTGDRFVGTFGTLGRAGYHAKRNPYPDPGQFTLVLPRGDSPSPQGDGYGIVKVDTAGRVSVIGELADGTPWSAAAPITNLDVASLVQSIYNGKGIISGTLSFPARMETEDWFWIKQSQPGDSQFPAGFATMIAARLSPYDPPANGSPAIQVSDVEIRLSNGGLLDTVRETGALSGQNVFAIAPPNLRNLNLQIEAGTGKVSGSFLHPVSGASTRLKGVVDQGRSTIHGFFLGTDTIGSLEVHALP